MPFDWLANMLPAIRNRVWEFLSNSMVLSWNFLHDDVIKWITVTGEFPSQRPVTRSFDVFYDSRLNKRLSKQLRRYRAHYDVTVMSNPCLLNWGRNMLFGTEFTLFILMSKVALWQKFFVVCKIYFGYAMKPVCNDHLYDKIHYLWFIQ